MSLAVTVAALSLLQPPVVDEVQIDVAYDELSAQQNQDAIERIEANEALDLDDPARLINLGIAYAREGRVEEARTLFEAAAQSETRYRLETASGEWVDSRWLAYRALAMIDEGRFESKTRVAAR